MLTDAELNSIRDGTAPSLALKLLGIRGRGEVFILGHRCVRLISRGTRVLRKDADAFCKILEAAGARLQRPLKGCLVIERAPICSKARRWLGEQGVEVYHLND